jgi:pilus assembly protein CpaF
MADLIRLEVRRPDQARPSIYEIEAGVYSLGADEDCRIRLSHRSVGGRHAILNLRPDSYWVEDLGKPGGTFVNGERIDGHREVRPGEEIRVGPFGLVVLPDERKPGPAAVPAAAPGVAQSATRPTPVPDRDPAVETALAAERRAEMQKRRSVKNQIHRELIERMDIRRLTASHIDRAELEKKARETVEQIVTEVRDRLPPGMEPATVVREVCDEALRLGPLEEFLADEEVTEIMVNGYEQLYVERAGKLHRTEQCFMDDSSVLAVIERIVAPLGRRIDESQPYVDARLPDGSRVNAIIPPLSLVGPCLTIRKFSKTPFTERDFVAFGTWPAFFAEFARICVLLRKNIVVSGGTGSGKTSLLNVLSSYLPSTDRIVTIEDAAELRLEQTHVVRLEARPPNIEGRGAVTIRDLVRNALRMRPDRIVVGECRGGEALDMLQAMNTGHDGSLTTVHANSPRDVISRLETMVLMSGMELPVRAIREQIASAIDLIIHESRFSDGSRKITQITEVVGLEGDQITMQDIFAYEQSGITPEGKVIGRFRATGSVPTFVEEVASRGLTVNRAMFDPQQWPQ